MRKELEAAQKQLGKVIEENAKLQAMDAQLLKSNSDQALVVTQLHERIRKLQSDLELAQHDAKVYKEQYLNAVSALKQ